MFPPGLLLIVLLAPAPSAAFALLTNGDPVSAARWTNGHGLEDGIQVGVDPGFAEAVGGDTTDRVARLAQAVLNSFAAWENDALRFDISFDTADDVEIRLRAVSQYDYPFSFFGSQFFGFGETGPHSFDAERRLTNGALQPGWVISSGTVYLSIERVAVLDSALPFAGYLLIFQRLLIHEIGHVIGLHHPNEFSFTNYDTDLDPSNPMVIDPSAPFANLIISPNRAQGAIMSNDPCGEAVACAEAFFTSLQNDDRGGRDVLYPVVVPEPTALWLLGLAGLALGRNRALPPRGRTGRKRAWGDGSRAG